MRLWQVVDTDQLPQALFVQRLMERGYPVVRTDQWATSATGLDQAEAAMLAVIGNGGQQAAVFDGGGTIAHLALYGDRVYASVAGTDETAIVSRLSAFRDVLPAPDPSSKHEVTVTFWTYGPHGPMPSWRTISVPDWSEIRANYAEGTRELLEGLMHGFRPAHGGQLVLWHGEAGTGKTFALRALAWEWREWCDLHYIVDPDSFFGQHADYLMNVLLQPGSDTASAMHATTADEAALVLSLGDDSSEQRREKGWRLLVLEDTGELLTPDAKTVIGQGLSRFLNVVDGLIGQGLRVLVLVTTNEEVRKLHPAVARPGRCAANVDFRRLSGEEATLWLAERGADGVAEAATIATLYALAEGLGDEAKSSADFED